MENGDNIQLDVLSMAEIISIAGDTVTFSSAAHRRKELLIIEARGLGLEVQARFSEAIRAKLEQREQHRSETKRHLNGDHSERRVRHRMEDSEEETSLYLDLPMENELMACYQAFYDATKSLLIATYYVRMAVIKLYPKNRHAGRDPRVLQSALRGNVTTFRMNMGDVVDMVSGHLLPQWPQLLPSVMSIAYVGSGTIPKDFLHKTFRVHRQVVADALRWLKENNQKYYGEIKISADRLCALPEDDVPDEILATMRHDVDTDVTERENESYVLLGDEQDDGDGDEHELGVIPLQYLGVHDTDLAGTRSSDLILWGLSNLSGGSQEGPYAVRHGQYPVRDFDGGWPEGSIDADDINIWEKAYPVLFPYGTGGLEAMRPAASREESENQPISNPAIRLLQRHVHTTASRVLGSNSSRQKLRSQIWSTTIQQGPPTIWMTINPDDLHDPIAQVFTSEDIDLDAFIASAGPDKARHVQNIAADPYAAAKFFHFIVNAIIRTLFGVQISEGSGAIMSGVGIFGRVSAYVGIVECQGRGTLYLHIILWVKNTPTPEELCERLADEDFRSHVCQYIRQNFHAHLPGLSSEEEIKAMATEPEVTYSRPPNPSGSDYKRRAEELEQKVCRMKQVHTCKVGSCLRPSKEGGFVCKRGAPWALADEDRISANGNWEPKRTFSYFNTWVPAISVNVRCNCDGKLLTNGVDTRQITFYITMYATKKQGRTYNASALLAKGLMFHFRNTDYIADLRNHQRLLLTRATTILNREQEIAAPLVMSYLMGWDDRFQSHHYTPVFWSSFVRALETEFEELDERRHRNRPVNQEENVIQHDNVVHTAEQSGQATDDNDEVVLIVNSNGVIGHRSQVIDYALRGQGLEDYNVMSFFRDTYEASITAQDRGQSGQQHRGRPRHERFSYLQIHPQSDIKLRVMRASSHNTIPNFIGQYFPPHDDPISLDRYWACMLLLFKPWRMLRDLRSLDETWEEAYSRFLVDAPTDVKRMIANIQHFYDCKNAADNANNDDDSHTNQGQVRDSVRDTDVAEEFSADDVDEELVVVTEEMITEAQAQQSSHRDAVHAENAVEIGRLVSLLPNEEDEYIVRTTAQPASGGDLAKLMSWQIELARASSDLEGDDQNASDIDMDSGVMHIPSGDDTEAEPHVGTSRMHDQSEVIHRGEMADAALSAIDRDMLLADQRHAFDIIEWHMRRSDVEPETPQLLMQIQGEGGTGKSKVIQTVSDLFKRLGRGNQLKKAAYTGIAASLIDEKTTHTIAHIGLKENTLSGWARDKLMAEWKNATYLVLDESSMLSRSFFAKLSRHISIAKTGSTTEDKPFGGVNVILCGDFHQFPPVATKKRASLYYPANASAGDSPEDCLGHLLYEQFLTVVILREQVRVRDPVWRDFLRHLWHGQVESRHINMLKTLTLMNSDHQNIDFHQDPWNNAVLVTPRHSVRISWNDAALRNHCRKMGVQRYVCTAEDTVRGRRLGMAERYAVALKKNSKGKGISGLPPTVTIAVGMKVMVTLNVDTDLDIANGARGEIVEIILDDEEPKPPAGVEEIRLAKLPAYILVKLDRTRAKSLDGLPDGVIPVVPAEKTFQVSLPIQNQAHSSRNQRMSVKRRQFPLTAAYSFTDYRSQGQTISYVIVDIASPPTGSKLTLFNIYVALSRSSGRDSIRLLREFDERLLTQSIDEALQMSDAWLSERDRLTKGWWESVSGGSHL
ncbi:hypothetical protein EW146_g6117 [Bondarzewia mesenterica]|uniref:ATP-dependent DNA helicase n=1 Tax=Bondarzewia mesenterica TaxID=1095465 RepID=A0A4S4LPJ2_9AGAM|nr:hypothetical protein EW146_g6117 [Bondarzewia mesenterica]